MPPEPRDPVGDPGEAATRRPRAVSLVRSLSYFVPSYAMAILSYLAYSFVAGRALGTAGFGYLMVILNVTTLIGQLSLLGVHRSGLREAARAESDELLLELRRGVRAVMLVPVPVAAALTAIGIWLWQDAEPEAWATAAFAGALVVAAAYQKVSANFLRGLGYVRAASLVTGRSGGALIAACQAIAVLVVWIAAPETGMTGILAGTVVGTVLPLIWASLLLRRAWPEGSPRGHLFRDLRQAGRRDWRFAASQTGGFLNSSVELWVAAALLTGQGTSLYAASQRLGHLLAVPSSSLQIVFSPALSRLSRRDEHGQLEPLVRTAASLSTLAAGVLWVPMVVVPGVALTLVYGAGFEAAEWALALIATGFLLNAVSGMSTTALSMAHHEGDVAVITWVTVVLRVAVGVLCAWQWGAVGLAASSASLAVIFYTATWMRARQLLSISTHATLRPRLSLLRRISG